MYDITLISSFHIIQGKCNPNELYKIIEKIKPDVIFEELPQQVFDIIYSEGNQPQSLEAIAIKKYIESYQIEHIPVDSYQVNESDLFNETEIIEKNSFEYSGLWRKLLFMINKYGYSFINSNSNDEIMERINNIEEDVLSKINDKELDKKYKREKEVHAKREDEMLRNIYNFSVIHSYSKAVFICGAEHRKQLIEKISDFEKKENFNLNWTLYRCSNIF
jgi:hypothetical protein